MGSLTTLAYWKVLNPKILNSDTLISQLIINASAVANRYVGRNLDAEDYIELFDYPAQDVDSPGYNLLSLKGRPINTITMVEYDPSGAFTGSQTQVQFSFDQIGTVSLINFNPAFTQPFGGYYLGFGNYTNKKILRVTYNAGYTTIPDDIQLAVCIITTTLFGRLNNNTFGIKGQFNISGELQATFELSIPQMARDILDTYKPGGRF